MTLDTLNRSGLAILAAMAPEPTAPRTIAAIMLDLHSTRADREALDRRVGTRDMTDAEEALWARLDQREGDLRDEVQREFRRVTGVDWRTAEELMA